MKVGIYTSNHCQYFPLRISSVLTLSLRTSQHQHGGRSCLAKRVSPISRADALQGEGAASSPLPPQGLAAPVPASGDLSPLSGAPGMGLCFICPAPVLCVGYHGH